jgi:hypothetical protein
MGRYTQDRIVQLQDDQDQQGLKVHRVERSQTFVRRSLRLPEHADLSKVQVGKQLCALGCPDDLVGQRSKVDRAQQHEHCLRGG